MHRDHLVIPSAAAAIAVAYLAGAMVPALLPVAVVTAILGVAAVATRSRPVHLVLLGLGGWLAVGISVAVLLSFSPRAETAFLLVWMFLLPLPVLPYLYWRTFSGDEE